MDNFKVEVVVNRIERNSIKRMTNLQRNRTGPTIQHNLFEVELHHSYNVNAFTIHTIIQLARHFR